MEPARSGAGRQGRELAALARAPRRRFRGTSGTSGTGAVTMPMAPATRRPALARNGLRPIPPRPRHPRHLRVLRPHRAAARRPRGARHLGRDLPVREAGPHSHLQGQHERHRQPAGGNLRRDATLRFDDIAHESARSKSSPLTTTRNRFTKGLRARQDAPAAEPHGGLAQLHPQPRYTEVLHGRSVHRNRHLPHVAKGPAGKAHGELGCGAGRNCLV